MSGTKEQSRPSKGGIRLDQYSAGNLAPTLTNPTNKSSQVESTEILEHPKAKSDKSSNERAKHYLRHWTFMILGIIFGAGLIVSIKLLNELRPNTQQGLEVASQIQVQAVDETQLADTFKVESIAATNNTSQQSNDPSALQANNQQTETSTALEVSADPEPSNIIEHARGREIGLQTRKFLFVTGSTRVYESDYLAGENSSSLSQESQSLSLKPLDNGTGRYRVNGTNVDWQGAWQPFNPEHNIKLGSTYTEYLNRTFGNTVGKNLSAINKEASSLLGQVAKPQAVPGGLK